MLLNAFIKDINHPSNEYIMPILAKNLKASHPSAYMILKLTWRALFDPLIYINRIQIAQGALSQVLYNSYIQLFL